MPSAHPVVPFLEFPKHINMLTGLAIRAVVFVGAEPIDEVAFRDHILLWKYKRPEFSESDPLADGTTVITSEVHNGTDVDYIQLRGRLTLHSKCLATLVVSSAGNARNIRLYAGSNFTI